MAYTMEVSLVLMWPLVARDIDMLCDDGTSQSCGHRCDRTSLPCITTRISNAAAVIPYPEY